MPDQEKTQNQSEEIDLLYLLRPISGVIKRSGSLLYAYFRSLWLNKWLFIGILAVSALIAYAMHFIVPRGYVSEAIFSSRTLNAGFCSLLVNNLDESSDKKDNLNILASQLKIKPEMAAEIKSMVATPMSDTFYIDRTDSAVSLFRISLHTSRKEDVKEIQNGILGFLENNEYALRRKEARLNSLRELNADFQTKISSLDSLKKLVNNSVVPRSTGQGIILGEPINPIDVYEKESFYFKAILENNEDLKLSENIEILQPFLLPDDYNYPDFKRLFLISMIIAAVIGLIITPALGTNR